MTLRRDVSTSPGRRAGTQDGGARRPDRRGRCGAAGVGPGGGQGLRGLLRARGWQVTSGPGEGRGAAAEAFHHPRPVGSGSLPPVEKLRAAAPPRALRSFAVPELRRRSFSPSRCDSAAAGPGRAALAMLA